MDADVAAKAVDVAMKPARSLRSKAERKLRFGLRVRGVAKVVKDVVKVVARAAVRVVVKDVTVIVDVVMDARAVSRSVRFRRHR